MRRLRVLIVDDAKFARVMLRRIIESFGHEVVGEAENGSEALEKYKQLQPDVVTMDITMPETDGIRGVQLIKAYDPKAKIIMCSAMGQKDFVLDAVRAGASDFIVKPYQQERVFEALKRIAERE